MDAFSASTKDRMENPGKAYSKPKKTSIEKPVKKKVKKVEPMQKEIKKVEPTKKPPSWISPLKRTRKLKK